MATKDIKYGGQTLPIRKFKLDSMAANPAIVMVAKRASGKSWVVRAILKHFKNIPGGTVIAPTDRMSSFYNDFIPNSYIHYDYSSDVIENILYRQKEIIKKRDEKKIQGKKVDPRAYLVMDDCLGDRKAWINDKPILEIFTNGRHYQLMYILTMQYPLGIPPILRGNFDYIFLLADDMHTTQKKIYEHYAGMFPSFELFRQVYSQLTEDYGCMVIVNRGIKKSLLDKIFWFKATDEELDDLGCSQFKKFHDDNYNKKWDDNKMIDIDKIMETKKNGKRVNVEKIG